MSCAKSFAMTCEESILRLDPTNESVGNRAGVKCGRYIEKSER